MYLSILTLLFGWAIFYGSVAVFIAFVAVCVFFNFAAVLEERALEARFGEAYLAYKNKVPAGLERRDRNFHYLSTDISDLMSLDRSHPTRTRARLGAVEVRSIKRVSSPRCGGTFGS
jgi:hypothetical protein